MPRISSHFATRIYEVRLPGAAGRRLVAELDAVCRATAAEDRAGQAWCRANRYDGYTSYASLDDLTERASPFAELARALDIHVAAFARSLELDLGRRRLALDSLWINVLAPGGRHTAHIHPRSVISGTVYVALPAGASAIRFEDPRLPLMMAAPMRKAKARPANRTFVEIAPRPGTILLWESFLRHEVPPGSARRERISLSFNYALA